MRAHAGSTSFHSPRLSRHCDPAHGLDVLCGVDADPPIAVPAAHLNAKSRLKIAHGHGGSFHHECEAASEQVPCAGCVIEGGRIPRSEDTKQYSETARIRVGISRIAYAVGRKGPEPRTRRARVLLGLKQWGTAARRIRIGANPDSAARDQFLIYPISRSKAVCGGDVGKGAVISVTGQSRIVELDLATQDKVLKHPLRVLGEGLIGATIAPERRSLNAHQSHRLARVQDKGVSVDHAHDTACLSFLEVL